ncbi:hypothetical protein CsSME_00033768 [Camellia sinensis var. sinensis]
MVVPNRNMRKPRAYLSTSSWPVDSRWPPLPAGDVPTALFRPYEEFLVFIAQEGARKCISDAQPASVLTSGRVFLRSIENCIILLHPFCIVVEVVSLGLRG